MEQREDFTYGNIKTAPANKPDKTHTQAIPRRGDTQPGDQVLPLPLQHLLLAEQLKAMWLDTRKKTAELRTSAERFGSFLGLGDTSGVQIPRQQEWRAHASGLIKELPMVPVFITLSLHRSNRFTGRVPASHSYHKQ